MAAKNNYSADDIRIALSVALRGEPAVTDWLSGPQAALYGLRPSDLMMSQAGRNKIAAMLIELGIMA